MSNFSQFFGGSRPPKAIINSCSTSGYVALNNTSTGLPNLQSCKTVLSGSITAATLKTILSLTGQGVVNFFAAVVNDVTARTLRIKVTIDGIVAFDSTSANITTGSYGALVIGSSSSSSSITFDPTYYNSSFLVEIASSLTETDKFTATYNYKTF